jgi:uncharacterized protein (DUF952 family)
MTPLFHIITREAWREALRVGSHRPESLATEGFIHLSEGRQWRATAARFFRGRGELLLLSLDPATFMSELRFEDADGDAFPHLYGPFAVEGVEAVEMSVDADGVVTMGGAYAAREGE